MTLSELQQLVVTELTSDPHLLAADLITLAEDQGDIETELTQALQRTSLVALVVTPEFTATQQDGLTLAGTAALRIAIYEMPSLNRARANHLTALQAAEHIIALALQWPGTTIESLRQTPVDDDHGGITVEVALNTYIIHGHPASGGSATPYPHGTP